MQAHWEHRLIHLAGNVTQPATHSDLVPAIMPSDAYAFCAQVSSHHSKSFYMASSLLPHEKRKAVHALYAFCRTVDDIVDTSTAANRESELDYWRGVAQNLTHPRPLDLVAQAWADARSRYHIPTRYALQLIDGVARDLSQSRYQSFDDLTTYCYGVASTVGLMSMHIVGFKSSEAVPYAIRLGVALQMTNILRDIGEDFRAGRIYLPQDELASYGIKEQDLALGQVTSQWRTFMRFQIQRVRQLYHEAEAGIQLLAKDGQLAIGAASNFYQGILDAIEANDYDVFTKRAHLSAWGKLSRLPRLWMNSERFHQ